MSEFKPTARQAEVAEYVVKYHAEHKKAPTTRQVAAHLGCSQNNAWRLMRALLDKANSSQ